MKITKQEIKDYKNHLIAEEKSLATIEKYVRDVSGFANWLLNKPLEKQIILEYKEYLKIKYAVTSINSVISSLNNYFEYIGMSELRLKTVKIQKKIFIEKEKQLTKREYEKLLKAALDSGNERLYLVMQTICSTGIRVSELSFITVEAIRREKAEIFCKGKRRCVFLPKDLCRILKEYAERKKIIKGSVFVTRTGTPLDRSNICKDMKRLCLKTGISPDKVFPHNLRHLFARTYYSLRKDIVRLADVLGHSNVNTTRIYTMETGEVHKRQIQNLGLVM